MSQNNTDQKNIKESANASGRGIRGVNLGNWLVLERWMEPEIFRGTDAEDETWLNRDLPKAELEKRLKKHRETFITEKDFEEIHKLGLNTVRIPVPYFIFGDFPPYSGCIEYLDRAFDWAERWDLRILIDLHTTPGNHNGYDNGGLVGVCRFHKEPRAVAYVLHVLERLARRYGKRRGLFGIEVLNEPISLPVYLFAPTTGKARDRKEAKGSGYVPLRFLRKFYKEAYRRLRVYLPEDKAIIFHDGFRLPLWGRFFERAGMKHVYLDTHQYIWAMEMFLPFHRLWLYWFYVMLEQRMIRRAERHVPVIVGEWSNCNRYAAFQRNRRYHDQGTNIWSERVGDLKKKLDEKLPEDIKVLNSIREYSQEAARVVAEERRKLQREIRKACIAEQRRRFRKVANMQLHAWEHAAGWFYWSWKLEPESGRHTVEFWKESWDYHRSVRNGWLPKKITK